MFTMMFDGCDELLMMTEDNNLFVVLCWYWQLYLLACTATCSLHNIAAFHRMSGVDFNKKHRILSPPEVFRQRNIDMRLAFTANYGTSTNSKVIDFLKSNDDDGAFVIYTNTASLAKKLHMGLKDALNASDLCVHGSQHALEKFHYTRAFCTNAVSKVHPDLNIGGFLSTNTGDTGLDHPHLTFAIMCELPRDMHSLIQRRGRCGRQGEESVCYLVMNLNDYLFTAVNIQTSMHSNKDNSYLTAEEPRLVFDAKVDEFMAVSSFVSMNKGCWHSRIESFCSNGYLTSNAIESSEVYPFCKVKCPICTNEWSKTFNPVDVMGIIHFFDSNYATRSFPMAIDSFQCPDLANLIWKNDVAIQLIYDRMPGTIAKYNVEALIVQLLNIKVLELSKVTADGHGEIVLGREKIEGSEFFTDKYKNTDIYDGIDRLVVQERKYKFVELL
jgi:hypothetical protein